MSLAESIYEYNKQEDAEVETLDDLGIPIRSSVDYYIDRVLAINCRDRLGEFSIYQYHVRDDEIMFGHSIIPETLPSFYQMTEVTNRVDAWAVAVFWKKVKKVLPRLDRNILQVSDNLFWDMENGEILETQEVYKRFGIGYTGSEDDKDIEK